MKDIKGYEGLYAINKKGQVWSYKRERYLKCSIAGGGKGYLSVSLCKNGEIKHYKISRLLAQTYIPNPNNHPVVDHKNINSLDNRLSNLRWVSYSDSMRNQTKPQNETSKYLGVFYVKSRKVWVARINIDGKRKYLGHCKTELEAIKAHRKYINKHFKGFYQSNKLVTLSPSQA